VRKAAFVFVFITVALDMIALGVMVPILPRLVVDLEGGDVAKAALITGVFSFAWAFMQFIASPVSGVLSDRFGRRPVILASNLGLGLDYVVMALAPSVPWLFVGRIISGITSASYPTACAYIADASPPEKRAAHFGLLGAAFGLGFIVGPAIGGALGAIDVRLPFWVAGGLSLANTLYGLFVLPESLPEEKRATTFDLAKANPVGALRLLRSQPLLVGLAASFVLMGLAHEVLPNTFVLYATARYAWATRDIGFALAAVGVSSTIVSAVLVGPATKWLGEKKSIVIGLGFGTVGMLCYGLAPTGAWFLAAIPVFMLLGISGPPMNSIASKRVSASQQGQLQGAFASIRGITGMIGPLLFTRVLAGVLAPGVPSEYAGAAFVLAAVLLFASAVVAMFALRGPDAPVLEEEAKPIVSTSGGTESTAAVPGSGPTT
jgi:DHA1 family tetracycline resistance protein-like MFS transporter